MPSLLNGEEIIMVDDSAPERRLARECYELSELTNRWCELAGAEELLRYLDAAKRSSRPLPALVLLDINMPYKNGFDALSEVRADPSFHELPGLLMFTNSSNPDDLFKSQALGADGYQTKPDNVGDYIDFFNGLPERFSA